MQRKRGELVPIGDTLADLTGPVQNAPRNLASTATGFHRRRPGEPVSESQRSGPPIWASNDRER